MSNITTSEQIIYYQKPKKVKLINNKKTTKPDTINKKYLHCCETILSQQHSLHSVYSMQEPAFALQFSPT